MAKQVCKYGRVKSGPRKGRCRKTRRRYGSRGGSSYRPKRAGTVCQHCGGAGKIRVLNSRDYVTCYRCHGTGREPSARVGARRYRAAWGR